jgi:hypothetical protein
MNRRKNMANRSVGLAAGAAMTMLVGQAAAAPVERLTNLGFSTRGQSLFGPGGNATRTESLR